MKHILVVEPDTVLANIYKSALQKQEYSVAVAGNAQLAIDQIDAWRPDIVVLELQLGGHGGVEFIYELRSHIDLQDIPIIIHTLTPLQDVKKFSKALDLLKVYTLLYKPTSSIQTLSNKIKHALQSTA